MNTSARTAAVRKAFAQDGTRCRITSRANSSTQRTESLLLHYEVTGDAMSDEYDWDTLNPRDLFDRWLSRYGTGDSLDIWWFVLGPDLCETATPPLNWPEMSTFSDHYFPLVEVATDRTLDVIQLPVVRKRWDSAVQDKGGFLPLVTGWQPSVFQPRVPTEHLRRLAHGRRFYIAPSSDHWMPA